MISNLNRSTFMGHLGADAKQANGTAPVTFSVAVSSHWTDNAGDRQTRTDWQNIVVFGHLRKYAAKLKKGDRVYVEAEARNNNYEREIGTETVRFYETEFHAPPSSGLRLCCCGCCCFCDLSNLDGQTASVLSQLPSVLP